MSAILPCRGGKCPPERTARHRFSKFSERYLGRQVLAVDMLYRCDDCGHERVWGVLDPAAFHVGHVH